MHSSFDNSTGARNIKNKITFMTKRIKFDNHRDAFIAKRLTILKILIKIKLYKVKFYYLKCILENIFIVIKVNHGIIKDFPNIK